METKITAIPPAPDPGPSQQTTRARPAKASEPQVQAGPDPAELRLVIEQDQATQSFVYKTINRVTGEVVQQLPRAEVLKLRQGSQYAAGAVIRTKA